MTIEMTHFGGHASKVQKIAPFAAPNEGGKTTLLNAYLFTLTGRTLDGFEARNVLSPRGESTQTQITNLFGKGVTLRRVLSPNGGTTLYFNGEVCTQTDFVTAMMNVGVDIAFAALCVDSNALTNTSLSSEDLRTLLARAHVMDNGEGNELRKEAADVRKKLKTAEQYALSNVSLPAPTCEDINAAEKIYAARYEECDRIVKRGTKRICDACGQELPKEVRETQRKTYEAAWEFVEATGAESEYNRITEKRDAFDDEQRRIADVQRLIDASTKARADVVALKERLAVIDDELKELDANAVRADLPPDVELITESVSKTGVSKSVCTLTYNGVPLKSVNRAKRIEICVDILDEARKTKGMQFIPIWVDNFEAVGSVTTFFSTVDNLITLNVEKC